MQCMGMNMTQEEKVQKLHQLQAEAVTVNKWRKKMLHKLMTDIAPRIAALNGKGYSGSGYHYGMVKEVGSLIRDLAISFHPSMNHLEKSCEDSLTWLINEVKAEELIKDLRKAERSLKRK